MLPGGRAVLAVRRGALGDGGGTAELRASGETARRRGADVAAPALTQQEQQVARLVAEGMSNRDVAARLFLSPRTIDFHLRNVFTKLGVTSRTEVARALAASSD
ncbi:helix-turn-helix domain-containing protein [Georgenia sp. SUBG003]|uniref:helix-turn-helix domain-containing protein n=1 Tax=Georgenia sp. SUBG003 TaxID=1497974 RepID=UPI003AB81ECC